MKDWLSKSRSTAKSFKLKNLSSLLEKSPVSSKKNNSNSLEQEMVSLLITGIEDKDDKRTGLALTIKEILSHPQQAQITHNVRMQLSNIKDPETLSLIVENYNNFSALAIFNAPNLSIPEIFTQKEYINSLISNHTSLVGTEKKELVVLGKLYQFHALYYIKGSEPPSLKKDTSSYVPSYLTYTPYKQKTLEPLNYFKSTAPLVSTESLRKIMSLAIDLDSSLAVENSETIPNPQKIIDFLLSGNNLGQLKEELNKLFSTHRITGLDKDHPIKKFLLEMESRLDKAKTTGASCEDFISANHRQITSLIDIAITTMPDRPVPKELEDYIVQSSQIPNADLTSKKIESLSGDEQVLLLERIEMMKSAHQQIQHVIEAFGFAQQGYKISDVSEEDWSSKKAFTIDDVRIPYISRNTQDLMHFVLFDWQKDVLHANSETVDGAKLKQLLLYFKDSVDKFPEHLPLLQEVLKDKLSKIPSLDKQPYHPKHKGDKIDEPFVDKEGQFSPEKLRTFIDQLYEGETSVTIELWSLCAKPEEKPYFDAWNKQKPFVKKLKDGDNSVADQMGIEQAYIFPIYTKMSANVISGSENNLEHYNQIIAKKKSDDTVDITYINPLKSKNCHVNIANSVFNTLLENMVHADTANPSPEADFLKGQDSFIKKLEELSNNKVKAKELDAEKQTGLECSTHSIRRGIKVVVA